MRSAWISLFVLACETPDERSASWSYVHPAVIVPSCATAGCHSAVSAAGGNDLSTRTSAFTMLTGITCGEELPGQPLSSFVRPYDPDGSILIPMLRGNDTQQQMPPDQPLPEVEIELIERWILEGAACD